jgi:hypothetical protein
MSFGADFGQPATLGEVSLRYRPLISLKEQSWWDFATMG